MKIPAPPEKDTWLRTCLGLHYLDKSNLAVLRVPVPWSALAPTETAQKKENNTCETIPEFCEDGSLCNYREHIEAVGLYLLFMWLIVNLEYPLNQNDQSQFLENLIFVIFYLHTTFT